MNPRERADQVRETLFRQAIRGRGGVILDENELLPPGSVLLTAEEATDQARTLAWCKTSIQHILNGNSHRGIPELFAEIEARIDFLGGSDGD